MKSSLSVVLPLYNSQAVLGGKIEELLEILPELTSRFDVVLVDDGSTDSTVEVAHELTLHFPQLRLIVHPARLGSQEALRSALRYSDGEQVLGCRNVVELDPHEIAKLWNRRTTDGAVFGLADRSATGGIPQPPATAKGARYGAAHDAQLPDMLLVPRRLLVGWPAADDREGVVGYLRARGYPVRSVEIRLAVGRPRMARIAAGLQRNLMRSAAARRRAADASASTARRGDSPTERPQKGPNYLLARLKAFALGE